MDPVRPAPVRAGLARDPADLVVGERGPLGRLARVIRPRAPGQPAQGVVFAVLVDGAALEAFGLQPHGEVPPVEITQPRGSPGGLRAHRQDRARRTGHARSGAGQIGNGGLAAVGPCLPHRPAEAVVFPGGLEAVGPLEAYQHAMGAVVAPPLAMPERVASLHREPPVRAQRPAPVVLAPDRGGGARRQPRTAQRGRRPVAETVVAIGGDQREPGARGRRGAARHIARPRLDHPLDEQPRGRIVGKARGPRPGRLARRRGHHPRAARKTEQPVRGIVRVAAGGGPGEGATGARGGEREQGHIAVIVIAARGGHRDDRLVVGPVVELVGLRHALRDVREPGLPVVERERAPGVLLGAQHRAVIKEPADRRDLSDMGELLRVLARGEHPGHLVLHLHPAEAQQTPALDIGLQAAVTVGHAVGKAGAMIRGELLDRIERGLQIEAWQRAGRIIGVAAAGVLGVDIAVRQRRVVQGIARARRGRDRRTRPKSSGESVTAV